MTSAMSRPCCSVLVASSCGLVLAISPCARCVVTSCAVSCSVRPVLCVPSYASRPVRCPALVRVARNPTTPPQSRPSEALLKKCSPRPWRALRNAARKMLSTLLRAGRGAGQNLKHARNMIEKYSRRHFWSAFWAPHARFEQSRSIVDQIWPTSANVLLNLTKIGPI